MPFKFVKNLIIIPVFINGKGPYDFILDTGVGPMVITDASILDSAQVRTYTPFKVFGLGAGIDLNALFTNKISVGIGHALSETTPTAVLADDIFNLSGYVGQPVYGLVGYSFFKSFVVRIRYDSKSLTFYNTARRVRYRGERIPIELTLNKPYLRAQVRTDSGDTLHTRLIIDTGGSHSLLLETFRNGAFPLPDTTIEANLGMGLSGMIAGKMGRIRSLQIGAFHVPDVLTGFPSFEDVAKKTAGSDRNGNLGANFLKKFNIILDYNGGFIYLKKNFYFQERSEHDMSGMSVFVDFEQADRLFVGRIEPGSPAQEAGFESGDELLKVNFKAAKDLSLTELDELFRSRDARPILVEVNRQGTPLLLLLRLKKRI
ncbi:PDZ domain-containing protein [Pedobacter yulinensis]|nr:PDZ domain-containing protein [Pedobacter yulinensis]